MKKLSCECVKEMPYSMKLAYILITILFILNIVLFIGVKKIAKEKNIDTQVTAWVDNNAETILKSVSNFVSKQQEEMQKKQQADAGQNIAKYQAELKNTKTAGVLNPSGTKDIVEFFDYNCGYCKMAHKNVNELLKTRKDVRVILRAIPILGEPSRYATEVGFAVSLMQPELFISYYNAAMDGSARTKEDVANAVEKAGLKMAKVEKFLEKNKEEISKLVDANLDLAQKVGINGTPAFIVGDQFFPGAVDAKTLEGALK